MLYTVLKYFSSRCINKKKLHRNAHSYVFKHLQEHLYDNYNDTIQLYNRGDVYGASQFRRKNRHVFDRWINYLSENVFYRFILHRKQRGTATSKCRKSDRLSCPIAINQRSNSTLFESSIEAVGQSGQVHRSRNRTMREIRGMVV